MKNYLIYLAALYILGKAVAGLVKDAEQNGFKTGWTVGALAEHTIHQMPDGQV